MSVFGLDRLCLGRAAAAFAFAALRFRQCSKAREKNLAQPPLSLNPGLPAARAAVAPHAEAICSRAPSTRPIRGLAPPFKRCQCLRLLANYLASGCPRRSRLRAALLKHHPSCQVLGSIAATTLFFAFSLTTFVLWVRCVSALVAALVVAAFLRPHLTADHVPLRGHSSAPHDCDRPVHSSYVVPYGTYMRADCLVLNSTQTMLEGHLRPLSRVCLLRSLPTIGIIAISFPVRIQRLCARTMQTCV